MTALQLDRKERGVCIRCSSDAGDTNLCEPHRQALNARVAASKRKRRVTNRLLPVSTTASS